MNITPQSGFKFLIWGLKFKESPLKVHLPSTLGVSKTSNTLASITQAFLDQVNLIRAKNRITVITKPKKKKKKDLLHLRKVKILIRIITNCSRESEWVNMDLWQILLGENNSAWLILSSAKVRIWVLVLKPWIPTPSFLNEYLQC